MFKLVAPYGYLLLTAPCICLWQISQIQTCLRVVVGPGFVSISSAFMRSTTSHPVGPHVRLVPKMVNRAPIAGREVFDTICTTVCNRWDSCTACSLCLWRLVQWSAARNWMHRHFKVWKDTSKQAWRCG